MNSSGLNSEAVRHKFISEFSVDYVFYGPVEKQIGDWNPSSERYLKKIYDLDGYSIFRVLIDASVNQE